MLPSKWAVIGRDAFNGAVLWKRPIPEWQTRMWPLKSGPAQLPRRLVASRDAVYVTLGIDVPLSALDPNTGEVIRVYEGTKGTEEILHTENTLFLLVNPAVNRAKYANARAVGKPWWEGETVKIVALRPNTGEILWEYASSVVPLSLAADGGRVFFHDGTRIVALNGGTGARLWRSEPVPLVRRIMSFFAPTMVAQQGVVLFAGGEESGLKKSGGGATKPDTLTALDAKNGQIKWTAEHLPSGYSSPEDLFVIGDTVWFAGVSNGNLPGTVVGLDLQTGKTVKRYPAADVQTYWFHHRCYRGKASSRYLITSRTGIEFIDPTTGRWDINHWTRGGCLYGIMPANGLIYTPPNNCACYPEAKISGFNALSAAIPAPRPPPAPRLRKGPAFGQVENAPGRPSDWPTFRHDPLRSGASSVPLASNLTEQWTTRIGGRLSASTVAGGKVFVADIDRHTVYALDADTGRKTWRFTAGGRVDSPPTIHAGYVVFGCADGWIYCLRATDGEWVWRFRAAPEDTRILSFEQLESRWPVHGSVLLQDNIVYAIAGRSLFLDGGMRLVRLEIETGRLVSEQILDEKNPDTGKNIQADTKRLTLPVALPDVLSGDGQYIYMRSQVFDRNGKRLDIAPHAAERGVHASVQEGPTSHLFASAGFLDGSWFHRAYWIYGRSFEGGWNSYYLAGKRVPAGKILAFDAERVYGFGRTPDYFRWTTPMEFQLFAAPRAGNGRNARKPEPERGTIVRVKKSKSLDPAGTPLAVAAWVKADSPNGVVLAHGGGILGYSLYLKKGKLWFAVANRGKRARVSSEKRIPAGWNHLAGTLDAQGKLHLYVNGEPAGAGDGIGLIRANPANELQIGADEESQVGDYRNGFPFTGLIDDPRIYHGEMAADTVRKLAGGQEETQTGGPTLVLHHTYDTGKAEDASGHRNAGQIIGAKVVEGKLGKALAFVGVMPGAQPATKVRYEWSQKAPLLVRGMLVAGKALVLAGPRDLLDEREALEDLENPQVKTRIRAQETALAGASGGLLLTVSTEDGSLIRRTTVETIPVWDGLSTAAGRLYLTGTDGAVRCFGAP